MAEKVVALYFRVSKEDNHTFQNESNSIISQRKILMEYIQNSKEFSGDLVMEFCDDGFSGINFSRPEVQKLFSLVKKGVVSCIIVKDFSRFGRNYIEVGNYLEQVFPFLGIRFISVNDGFDSKVCDFTKEYFDISFKNLVYDLYSKDLSNKVSSVRHSKAAQGKFFTAYAPYGYLKTAGQKLVPDNEAALIVQRIFNMAREGVPKAHIAKILNNEGIPSPFMLRKLRGEKFPCKMVNKKSVWGTAAIVSILKDQRYTGDAVYGKVKPKVAGSRQNCIVPREQWVIVPNANPAIISHEEFETVNAMFRKRIHYQKKKAAPLAGMVCCAECKHTISRVERRKMGEQVGVYRCSMQNITKEFGCCPIGIEEGKIENAIMQLLKKMVYVSLDNEIISRAKNSNNKKIAEAEGLVVKYKKEIGRLGKLKRIKYELYKDKLILQEEFIKEKIMLDKRIEKIQLDIKGQEHILDKLKEVNILKLGLDKSLTREIAEVFIGRIFICRDGSLRIQWKFKNFLALL